MKNFRQQDVIYQGVVLSSYWDDLRDYKEMVRFCEIGSLSGVNSYIKSLHIDKEGVCHIETILPLTVLVDDPVFCAIQAIALKTLSTYKLRGMLYSSANAEEMGIGPESWEWRMKTEV